MPDLVTQLDTTVKASLKTLLVDRILNTGPITFHDWMSAALYEPALGYYMRTDLQRWGREGDYRTSPERSRLFAATFAGYFATLHEELGRPTPFTVIEFGAGDGSFAHGVLSYLRDSQPTVFSVIRYLIDEISEDAQHRIRTRLKEFADKVDFISLSDLAPLEVAVVFSNEFLDALPVHRLQTTEGKLRELYVCVDRDGEFEWLTGEVSTPWLLEFVENSELELRDGQIFEVSRGVEKWFQLLSTKLTRGYVVSIDYGRDASDLYDFSARPEGTLRSYSRHRFQDVLSDPGVHDITTTIDWTYVKRSGVANEFTVSEFQRLDRFLLKHGLLDLLPVMLGCASSEAERLQLTTSAREMILPNGMASSFQTLVQVRT